VGDALVLGKAQKKYKHVKKTLEASQGSSKPVKKLIPYPTGQIHGRGNFNLADYLYVESSVSKEDYNTFIVRDFTLLELSANPIVQHR
jgi:hypothetical protein